MHRVIKSSTRDSFRRIALDRDSRDRTKLFVQRATLTNSMAFMIRTIFLFVVMAGSAKAAVIMTLTETPAGVTAAGSGTIDLTDLAFLRTTSDASGINASAGFLEVSANSGPGKDLYTNIVGPATFGTGGFNFAGGSSGDSFGVRGEIDAVSVPNGYVSGTLLSGTWTLPGQSFASLGINEGTYVWNWGAGANSDSLTINASVAPPPVPALAMSTSTLVLTMLGLLLLSGIALRKTRSLDPT